MAALLATGLIMFFLTLNFGSAATPPPDTDFSHTTHVAKEKLNCASCHKFPSKTWKEARPAETAFPDVTEFPQHDACLKCHRRQFFARERPVPRICLNCHVKATPSDTARYPFPSLGEAFLSTAKAQDFSSEFRVFFPHDKHADADCSDCHQTYQPQDKSDEEFVIEPPKELGDGYWLKKGTFKTRPLTHEICFTCHNEENELSPLPPECGTCHRLRAPENTTADFDTKLTERIGVLDWWTATAWRARISAGAFRHEAHPDVECKQCHDVSKLNTISSATRRVPVKACGGAEGCHITANLDDGGILNYEIDQKNKNTGFVCTKCHLIFGNKPVPPDHLSVIPKTAGVAAEQIHFAHAASPAGAADYSRFKHDDRNHARLPCLLCHRRENNSPRPTLPGKADHTPCTGCHQPQFANPSSPICTICHTDVESGKVKAFPPLRSFTARFDHARHTSAACSTCHRPNRRGVAQSIPSRLNAHVTCFRCHTPDAQFEGRNIASCSTCHQLGLLVRTSEGSRAYRIGFSHASHDASEKLTCAACHRVRAGLARGRQVTAPVPLNHHARGNAFSCATCHNGRRTFGGDDFSACKRCHDGSAWRF